MSFIYRIKYKKNGPLKYISHLDLNALFRRTLRRTQIPVELSQGYNPRFKVSFGPALPLGIAGWQEILDVFLTEEVNQEEIKKEINKVSPDGLTILEVQNIPVENSNLSKSLQWAMYRILLKLENTHDEDKLNTWDDKICLQIKQFLAQKNITAEKKSKKGLKEINLRPYIENMIFLSREKQIIVLRLIIDISYQGSINPYLIVKKFLEDVEKNTSNLEKINIENIIRERLTLSVENGEN